MLQVQLNVGVGFIAQTPYCTTGFAGWGQIRTAFAAGGRVIHQQAGTSVAVELKPAALIRFLLQRSGALRHRLGC